MDAKENFLAMLNWEEFDHIPVFSEVPRQELVAKGAWEQMKNGGVDCWGIRWQSVDQPGVMAMPIEHPIASAADIDNYEFPDPDQFELTDESRLKLAEAREAGDLLVVWSPMLLFERAWSLMGMEELMIALLTDTERVRRLIRRIADYQIAVARYWIDLKVDFIRFTDDLGAKTSMLLSPQIWREIFRPEMQRVFAVYQEAGIDIWFHCCGHIEEIVSGLVELGIRILDPVQASANNLGRIRSATEGKVTLWGGIDSHQLMTAEEPNDIKQMVREAITILGRTGGYVVAPDQDLPYPEENIRALERTVRKYGKHFG